MERIHFLVGYGSHFSASFRALFSSHHHISATAFVIHSRIYFEVLALLLPLFAIASHKAEAFVVFMCVLGGGVLNLCPNIITYYHEST